MQHAVTGTLDLNSGLTIFLLDPHVGGDGLVMVIRHRDPDKTWTIRHPSSWRPNWRRRLNSENREIAQNGQPVAALEAKCGFNSNPIRFSKACRIFLRHFPVRSEAS